MVLSLDHIVIAVSELEAAIADYQALGFTVSYGGEHASGSTHNALICFRDGTYLELLAPTGKPARPGTVDFRSMLQNGEGIVAYAIASDRLVEEADAMRGRGIDVGELHEGGRKRDDGIELRWQTAAIDGGMTPFLIQDITPRNLRVPDDAATTSQTNGVRGIRGLVMNSAVNDKAVDRYVRMLDVTPVVSHDGQRYTFPLATSSIVLAARPREDEQSYRLWLASDEDVTFDPQKTHGAVISAST